MIFTRDLLSQGASEPELRRVRKTTSKVRHGVYAAEVEDDWHLFDLKCAATLRLLKPGAALAGPAAARHWGLPLVGEPPGQVHVRGITRGGYGRGVKVVNGGRPALIEHHGLQVTSVAWTVVDCARLLPRRDALMVADAALHLRMCTHEDLVQAAASLGKAKGVGRVRWIIANADPASESAGETWMRMIVKDLGYAVTSQHRSTPTGTGTASTCCWTAPWSGWSSTASSSTTAMRPRMRWPRSSGRRSAGRGGSRRSGTGCCGSSGSSCST